MFEEWLLNGKEGDAVTLFEIFKTAPEDGSGATETEVQK